MKVKPVEKLAPRDSDAGVTLGFKLDCAPDEAWRAAFYGAPASTSVSPAAFTIAGDEVTFLATKADDLHAVVDALREFITLANAAAEAGAGAGGTLDTVKLHQTWNTIPL
jgi:hypothetical protein